MMELEELHTQIQEREGEFANAKEEEEKRFQTMRELRAKHNGTCIN